MKIKDLPKEERPREKFLKYGPENLSDAELFALLLRTGNKQENVIEMSHRLINEYGIENLFQCSLEELKKIKGIGQAKAIQLLVIGELNKRYSNYKKPIKKIICSEDVFNLMRDKLKEEKQEKFYVLHLNTKNILLKEELVSLGTIDSSLVSPINIFKSAIKNSVNKIILIHNHPSGDPTPSEEDLEVTSKLSEIGELLGIKILDHIIIGKEGFWSWKEKRL